MDKYYKENGTVVIGINLLGEKIERVGDRYGIVKINENIENFYRNKLEELFGKNILFVSDTYFNRVMKDYSFENILKVRDEEGIPLVIIYIFGRVENDEFIVNNEDKEKLVEI